MYLPFVRSAEGATWFAGPRVRLKWMPLRPAAGGAGYFAGVNAELSFLQQRFDEARRSVEIRPIVGYRNERWLFSFNPVVEFDLAGEERRVVFFSPAAKLSRDIGNQTALGLEYYADLGRLSHFAPRAEQEHTLFLAIDTPRVNFGVGRGFSGAADRWTVKAIFDF